MGIFAPTALNFSGSARNSLISSSSSSASSTPATSAKVTSGFSLLTSFAFDLPKFITPPAPPPCMLESISHTKKPMSTSGSSSDRPVASQFGPGTSSL